MGLMADSQKFDGHVVNRVKLKMKPASVAIAAASSSTGDNGGGGGGGGGGADDGPQAERPASVNAANHNRPILGDPHIRWIW